MSGQWWGAVYATVMGEPASGADATSYPCNAIAGAVQGLSATP